MSTETNVTPLSKHYCFKKIVLRVIKIVLRIMKITFIITKNSYWFTSFKILKWNVSFITLKKILIVYEYSKRVTIIKTRLNF